MLSPILQKGFILKKKKIILKKGVKKEKINTMVIDKKMVSQSASPEHKKSKAINNVKEELMSSSLSPSRTKSAYGKKYKKQNNFYFLAANHAKQPFSPNQLNLQNLNNDNFNSSYDDLYPILEEKNISGHECIKKSIFNIIFLFFYKPPKLFIL